MLNYWQPSPAFATGQVFSASGHGAGLIDNTNALLAAYQNGRPPFTSISVSAQEFDYWHHPLWGRVDGNWLRIWSGGIRHKTNSFKWSIRVADHNGGPIEIRLMYDATAYTLVSSATPGTFSGTVTLSGHTVDALYAIHIDVDTTTNPENTSYTILYLYEAYTPTLASLASFADTTTPSVANWQALSARANTLHDFLIAPIPCFLGGLNTPLNGIEHDLCWQGTFTYLSRYLYYHVRTKLPGFDYTAEAILTVNGTPLTIATVPASLYWPSQEFKDVGDYDFEALDMRGTVDLNALGLTLGNTYEASLSANNPGDAPLVATRLLALWTQPQSNPTLAWWSTMTDQAHGTAVSVQAIRDNLTALSSRAIYANIPAARRNLRTSVPYWSTHTYRHLHYRVERPPNEGSVEADTPSPSLGYWNGFEWIESGLDYEDSKWLQFDMSNLDRFWEGTPFRLTDVTYALQDVIP